MLNSPAHTFFLYDINRFILALYLFYSILSRSLQVSATVPSTTEEPLKNPLIQSGIKAMSLLKLSATA